MSRLHSTLLTMILLLAFVLGACTDEFDPIGDIDPDVPFPVTDLALTARGDTTVLVWTATGDDGPNGTATRYDLRSHTKLLHRDNWPEATPIAGVPAPAPAGTPESFVLGEGVAPQATVYFALRVIDDSGNASLLSNVVYADLGPPEPVTDLSAARVSDSYVRLAWTAPVDDGPLGHPDRYEIRVSDATLTRDNWNDGTVINGPTHAAEAGQPHLFNLTGLEPETHYFVAIRSRDEAGNLSDLSNVLEVDTPAPPIGWSTAFGDLAIDEMITGLHVHQDTLFVGGRFTSVEGLASRGLVSFDGTGWHGYGTGVSPGQWGSLVREFVTFGEDLYLGGVFSAADGQPMHNIARWTGTAFESLGNSRTKGLVARIQEFEGDLYVSWVMDPSSNSPFEWFNRFDGNDFHSLGWTADSGIFINAMGLYGGRLVMAGDLGNAPGLSTQSVALWDGERAVPLGPDLAGGRFGDPWPTALCVYDGDLYVAGDFTHAGDVPVGGIARWDGTAWHPVGGGLGGENPFVNAMVVHEGFLVITGVFATAGGQVVNNLARWDGSFWEPFGSGLEGEGGSYVNGTSLAVYRGSLYVGGIFLSVDGTPSRNLARWDLD